MSCTGRDNTSQCGSISSTRHYSAPLSQTQRECTCLEVQQKACREPDVSEACCGIDAFATINFYPTKKGSLIQMIIDVEIFPGRVCFVQEEALFYLKNDISDKLMLNVSLFSGSINVFIFIGGGRTKSTPISSFVNWWNWCSSVTWLSHSINLLNEWFQANLY